MGGLPRRGAVPVVAVQRVFLFGQYHPGPGAIRRPRLASIKSQLANPCFDVAQPSACGPFSVIPTPLIRRPLLPVGRRDLDLPTGFCVYPNLPAKSAGKHKCVNRAAVQDADTQIALFRDIIERVDRLPHTDFLGLDLKASFDLPQLRPKVFRGRSMETGPCSVSSGART